jgi:hypothetical protein
MSMARLSLITRIRMRATSADFSGFLEFNRMHVARSDVPEWFSASVGGAFNDADAIGRVAVREIGNNAAC